MKKVLLILLFPAVIIAQYNQEVATEESFENSELFFESYFLNTFGLNSFKDAAPGYVDDPFLNLYINPANLPDFEGKEMLVYLDFTGDREESDIIIQYPYPYYYMDYRYVPNLDPRWLTSSRREPAPIASFGILTYPLGEFNKNLFLGGTYQLIHKEESFYSVPYWIYNGRMFMDSFGNAAFDDTNIPIIDRYSGENEMITTAHLFSVFLGYKLGENLSAGFAINGVNHSRAGSYLDQSQDEYGTIDFTDWQNYSGQERDQDYSHLDLSLGVSYNFSSDTKIGIKIGRLNGEAEQTYTSANDNMYEYRNPSDTLNWNKYFSNSSTDQKWDQNGNSKYFSVNFSRKIKESILFSAYYRYTTGTIDLINNSAIADTSDNFYRWHSDYNNSTYESEGRSSTYDNRSGTGLKEKTGHQAAFNFRWQLNETISFTAGIYFRNNEINTTSTEPVLVSRFSENSSSNTDPVYNYNYYYKLVEDKTLVWNYTSKFWTFQVPVMLNAKINENIDIMFGLNRTLNNWEIENITTAYFNSRERWENNDYWKEENFGERYTEPTRHISDNYTDLIAGMKIRISPDLNINLLLNPEFESSFRVTQWQLSFYGLL